jgi:3,5-dihydroxyphenylacetyl-CoA synthase
MLMASPQVPYLMGLKIPGMVHRLLAKHRLRKEDIAHWVVHSGGKKVLDCVMYSLGLSKHAIRHSLNSLRAMGNMSSGSFLWAYESLLREKIAKRGEYGMFITMGPGAGVECALWRFL